MFALHDGSFHPHIMPVRVICRQTVQEEAHAHVIRSADIARWHRLRLCTFDVATPRCMVHAIFLGAEGKCFANIG